MPPPQWWEAPGVLTNCTTSTPQVDSNPHGLIYQCTKWFHTDKRWHFINRTCWHNLLKWAFSNIIKLAQDKTLSLRLVFPYHAYGKTSCRSCGPPRAVDVKKRSEFLQKKIGFRDRIDTDSYFCLPDSSSVTCLDRSGTDDSLLGAHHAPEMEGRRSATAKEMGKDLPARLTQHLTEALPWTFQLCFCLCSCCSLSLKAAQNQAAEVEETQRNHLVYSTLWNTDQFYFVICGICHSSYMSSLFLKPSSDGVTQPPKEIWFNVLLSLLLQSLPTLNLSLLLQSETPPHLLLQKT